MRGLAVLTVLFFAVALVACGGGPDREEISAEVATEWVEDSTEVVSELVVKLLLLSPTLGDTLGKLPGAESLLAGLVADQMREKVGWSYSTPAQDREALYRVTAAAALEIEIDLPIIGEQPYAVTLPFHLLIDTDARVVDEWAVDLEGAAVASY